MNKRILAIAATVLLGTAACGGNDDKADGGMPGHDMPSSAAPSATAKQNAQDVMFAQMMIPHHRQAVEMSKVVAAGSADAEVKRLAAQIERAQGPEIETMSGWLRQWDEPVPAEGAEQPAMSHHGGGMAGMMTPEQMAGFKKLKGKALDRRFLTMMIEHHEGAVTMAQEEQAKGSYPAAKTMAGEIVRTQQDEIAAMKKMLRG
ncbi:DUF305 domain-containing protein [Actinomadura hibisca]|uniref:DUF305 domain-containing protein n=1 Tax=Actinomadura hibisca TaxID=68565 RepID=UPI000833C2F4|nr:DUF305 domain-containing protein [Actinomadura hibisca]